MGSLRAYLMTMVAGALVATACGGSDFDGGGSGGADAGGSAGQDAGTSGSAGAGGSAGAPVDAAPARCRGDFLNATCTDTRLTTGDTDCDACGQANCCPQIDTCLADPNCAPVLLCYLENCLGESALGCMAANCIDCKSGFGAFLGVSSCLQGNCGPPNNTQCPMLLP